MADDDIIGVGMPAEGPPQPCDRCGSLEHMGAAQTPTLGTVCFDCLTDDDQAELLRDIAREDHASRN
ncbi:MAG TPA: hypothetical protein VES79_12105 [Solirubrobacteraceae bacterium]|nr:hypothetical protein [Solirubrobacteraceae bacterium]